MKRVTALGLCSLLIPAVGGCGTLQFGALPAHPSSITVTRYSDPASAVQRSPEVFQLTGAKMRTLYRSLRQAAKHPLPRNAGIACGDMATDAVVWDYTLLVRYVDHGPRTFTQTNACRLLTDDQTHARELGGLPELSPAKRGVVQWLRSR